MKDDDDDKGSYFDPMLISAKTMDDNVVNFSTVKDFNPTFLFTDNSTRRNLVSVPILHPLSIFIIFPASEPKTGRSK